MTEKQAHLSANIQRVDGRPDIPAPDSIPHPGPTLPFAVPKPRTRFARLYADGGLNVEPPEVDLETARKSFCDSSDDDDVEILEVEIVVVRRHGKPKLQAIRDTTCRCPTCGELVTIQQDEA